MLLFINSLDCSFFQSSNVECLLNARQLFGGTIVKEKERGRRRKKEKERDGGSRIDGLREGERVKGMKVRVV